MLVREAMTSPAVTVREDDTVHRAAQLLVHHRVSSAPVVSALGTLRGMVSEADLPRPCAVRDPRERPAVVGEVMTTRVCPVHATDDVADAARLLFDHGVEALPVLDGHLVVGVLARRDLLRRFARPDQDACGAHGVRGARRQRAGAARRAVAASVPRP